MKSSLYKANYGDYILKIIQLHKIENVKNLRVEMGLDLICFDKIR